MTGAKNYKTVSKFVKVMPGILWPLFFRHDVLVDHKSKPPNSMTKILIDFQNSYLW